MKNKIKHSRKDSKKKFSRRNVIVVLSLILFFPVGILLMWKFATWNKRTKWIVSGSIMSLLALGMINSYFSKPVITVNDNKHGMLSTDNSSYVVTGYLASMRGETTLSINNKTIAMNDELEFSHQLSLVEGDNLVKFKATNDNGTTVEDIILHRTTSAEFALRKAAVEAEAVAKTRLESERKANEAKIMEDKEAIATAKEAQEAAKAKAKENQAVIAEAEMRARKAEEKAEKVAADREKKDCNLWCRLTSRSEDSDKQSASTSVKIGSTVTSGNFAFKVNSLKCGETNISWLYGGIVEYYSDAQGKFCRLNLTIKNVGNYEDSISVWDQYLYNDKNQQWSYDGSATSTAAKYLYGNPLMDSINPGNSITGDIIYDVPHGQMPSYAEVDGGMYASAKKILLN